MTGNPSDERLSAWLDNELSLDERAEFEKELEANPELRRELEELQQVSAHVKGAVPAKAPEELRSAVMRAVERESLMPAAPVSASPFSGNRLGIAIGIAAGLLVAVVVMNRGGNDEIAEVDPAPILTAEQGIGTQPANRSGGTKPKDAVQVNETLSISKTDLSEARVGDIIEGIGSDGVSVIRLTVVNRDESSIEALQVILARESLPVDEDGKVAEGKEGLVAVYVESSPEELSRALAQIRDGFAFNSLDVSSLALSDLEQETQDDLKLTGSGQRTVVLKPGTRLAQLAKQPKSGRKPDPAAAKDSVRVIFVVVDQPAGEPAAKVKPATGDEAAA
jgi:negative regulator of sigma E activity